MGYWEEEDRKQLILEGKIDPDDPNDDFGCGCLSALVVIIVFVIVCLLGR